LDKDTRIEKIKEVTSRESYSFKELTYKKRRKKLPVYEIPIEFLIFNQYNGRIGTYVKTYEKQYGSINSATPEGEKIIVNFLWESKENRNKETKKDIEKNGQMEYGIVTKDGIIIDGNRRCMILKKIAKERHDSPTYFLAVVLEDTFEDNPKEIRKLETTYQMGVDEKVDYNAIEKYLACKDLSSDFTNEAIGRMMGENPSKIKEYLEILELMEKYLKQYGYEGMYTRLNEETVEGPFVDLRGYLEKQTTGKGIQRRDWEPKPEEIGELRDIYFDYIRAGFRTAHGIRDIGNPSKGKGFFNHKNIWNEFKERYYNEIEDKINVNESSLDEIRNDNPLENVEKIIAARDKDWKDKVESSMKKNYGITKRKLDDFNETNSPAELLSRAHDTLLAINTDNDAFDESILDIVKQISSLAWDFQQIIKNKSKKK